jgi:lipoyl synthase
MSGPLVRSSYRAGRLYRQALQTRQALSVHAAAM